MKPTFLDDVLSVTALHSCFSFVFIFSILNCVALLSSQQLCVGVSESLGPRGGPNETLLLIYQQNLWLLFHWLKHAVSDEGGPGRAGKPSSPNTWDLTRDKHADLLGGVGGGFHTQIKSFAGKKDKNKGWDDTTRCIFELNAVSVQDCQKKTNKQKKKM